MDPQQIMDAMHRLMIRQEAALWFETGRAIYAWRLRKIFRDAKWPVPEEIEQYLDACTERLCETDLKEPEQIADAFQLDRKGRNAKCSSNQLAAAERVFALLAMNPDWTLTKAIGRVVEDLNARPPWSEKGTDSWSFVSTAYYTWLEIQKTR